MLFSLTAALACAALSVTAAPLSKRSQFSGNGTWYGAGVTIGNCGWQSSGLEPVVALNTAQYGSTDAISPYCGQTVTIFYNGITKQATIVDSCPTCSFGDLDMSKSLFSAFSDNDLDLGVLPIEWSFGTTNDVAAASVPVNEAAPAVTAVAPAATTLPYSAVTSSTTTSSSVVSPSTSTAMPLATSTPQWWATLGTGSCPDVILPAGMDPVALSPSKLADADALPSKCGKTLQITNPALNRTTTAMLTNFYLASTSPNNTIYMNDAYLKIANTLVTFEGTFPYSVANVTWGFLD